MRNRVQRLWRRCERALAEGTREVSEKATVALHDQFARSWFILAGELGQKGRDELLDALPSVLVQAIYRLMVDCFPPEHAQLAQHAETLLEKLGAIVHYEVSGFRPSPSTLLALRRKLFRKPVLDHPHLDLLEARRVELRQQKLEGQRAQAHPLAFGDIKTGQALEEMQLEHVMELREASAAGRGGASITLPPLVPPELSVDRYAEIASHGEDMFFRHLEAIEDSEESEEEEKAHTLQVNPQMRAEGEANEDATLSQTTSNAFRRTVQRISIWGPTRASLAARQAEIAERRRRDELLASKIATPLPADFGSRGLATGAVSPMLERLAPGVQAKAASEAQGLRMAEPSAKFLPELVSAAPRQEGPRETEETPPASRAVSWQLAHQRTQSVTSLATPAGKERVQQPVDRVPLRLKKEVVMKRLDQELEALEKRSFEAYKKDYDILTGQKKVRLDGDRLAKEEDTFVHRLEGLVGSRSTPALKPLGLQSRVRQGGRRAAAVAPGDASGSLRAAGGQSPARGGRQPWNELTSLEGPPLRH